MLIFVDNPMNKDVLSVITKEYLHELGDTIVHSKAQIAPSIPAFPPATLLPNKSSDPPQLPQLTTAITATVLQIENRLDYLQEYYFTSVQSSLINTPPDFFNFPEMLLSN